VIEACALQPDINSLPSGDTTEIGEKVKQNSSLYFWMKCGLKAPDSLSKDNLFTLESFIFLSLNSLMVLMEIENAVFFKNRICSFL